MGNRAPVCPLPLADTRWDCAVRLKFSGISQLHLAQFLEHIASVADMYSAREFVVEIPSWQELPGDYKNSRKPSPD